jgi:hypothetical protein
MCRVSRRCCTKEELRHDDLCHLSSCHRVWPQGRQCATAVCLVRVCHLCACVILCAISPSLPQPPLREPSPRGAPGGPLPACGACPAPGWSAAPPQPCAPGTPAGAALRRLACTRQVWRVQRQGAVGAPGRWQQCRWFFYLPTALGSAPTNMPPGDQHPTCQDVTRSRLPPILGLDSGV